MSGGDKEWCPVGVVCRRRWLLLVLTGVGSGVSVVGVVLVLHIPGLVRSFESCIS